jgi:hypothetical protein
VLFALVYLLLRRLVLWICGSRNELLQTEVEVVVLRHQLKVLQRQLGRPRLRRRDRLFLAALSRVLPRGRCSAFVVSPQTLLRWHRELVRRKWTFRRKSIGGRPPITADVRDLILQMGRENPRWGCIRIRGELAKLGIMISATKIRTLLRAGGLGPAPRRDGPTWSQFLRSQASRERPSSSPPRLDRIHHHTVRLVLGSHHDRARSDTCPRHLAAAWLLCKPGLEVCGLEPNRSDRQDVSRLAVEDDLVTDAVPRVANRDSATTADVNGSDEFRAGDVPHHLVERRAEQRRHAVHRQVIDREHEHALIAVRAALRFFLRKLLEQDIGVRGEPRGVEDRRMEVAWLVPILGLSSRLLPEPSSPLRSCIPQIASQYIRSASFMTLAQSPTFRATTTIVDPSREAST